jgi:hypothetical protein
MMTDIQPAAERLWPKEAGQINEVKIKNIIIVSYRMKNMTRLAIQFTHSVTQAIILANGLLKVKNLKNLLW